MLADSRHALWLKLELRTWPDHGPADHVPDNETIDLLFLVDDLCSQTNMDPRPSITLWVRSWVLANAPDVKLLGVWGTLEDVRVVAVQTAFQLNNR